PKHSPRLVNSLRNTASKRHYLSSILPTKPHERRTTSWSFSVEFSNTLLGRWAFMSSSRCGKYSSSLRNACDGFRNSTRNIDGKRSQSPHKQSHQTNLQQLRLPLSSSWRKRARPLTLP